MNATLEVEDCSIYVAWAARGPGMSLGFILQRARKCLKPSFILDEFKVTPWEFV